MQEEEHFLIAESINRIESIISTSPEPVQDKTAEEMAHNILVDFGCPEPPFDEMVTMYHPAIISAMEEYLTIRTAELCKELEYKDQYYNSSISVNSRLLSENKQLKSKIERLESGMANWVRVANERQEEINRLEAELSALTAPSSIGEEEIYRFDMLTHLNEHEQYIFKLGCRAAISRLSERKIVLPDEMKLREQPTDPEHAYANGWNLAIKQIKELNGIKTEGK